MLVTGTERVCPPINLTVVFPSFTVSPSFSTRSRFGGSSPALGGRAAAPFSMKSQSMPKPTRGRLYGDLIYFLIMFISV